MRVRIWRYVHRHQWTSESHCSSSVSRRKAATQRAYRRLTLVHIVNPCSFARSGTGVDHPGTGYCHYTRNHQMPTLTTCESLQVLQLCRRRPPGIRGLPAVTLSPEDWPHRKAVQFVRSGDGGKGITRHGAGNSSPHPQFASLQVARSTRSCPDHHEGDLLIVWASTRWAARP